MIHPTPLVPEPNVATGALHLRTGAWYGDRPLALQIPASWHVELCAPAPSAPLTDEQIAQRLDAPLGQSTIRELCRGKARPTLIVDDLNRPTPAARVVPLLLRQFEDAGIAARDITIVMAPGTHGAPAADALVKKIGAEAASSCRVHIHNCHRDVVRVGRTSFGTPVLVNKQVAASDVLVGVGGIYPNYTAGFGGGAKLALGVLGFRSIAGLHYGHPSVGWGKPNSQASFRRDLDEIARMIGLETTVSLLLNADRDVTEVFCGAPHVYYADGLQVASEAFRAPRPAGDANVVVSNAYPNDLSLTFARMKGMAPFRYAPPGASRIAIASCSEGLGFHGLFPFMNAPRFHQQRMLAVRGRVALSKPGGLLHKVRRRLTRQSSSRGGSATVHPIWLYCPDPANVTRLPASVPGMRVTSSWDEIVESIGREQSGAEALRVYAYTCAPLQWLA